MRDGEWSRATHLTGFRQAQKDRLVSRDAEICIAAGGECLYVAAIAPAEGSETDGGFVAVGEDGTVAAEGGLAGLPVEKVVFA